MPEEKPNPSDRSAVRTWTDSEGIEWRIWLKPLADGPDGGRMIFTPDPKQEIGCPKVAVRRLKTIHRVPERRLPFYLQAARVGGFVWLDRDGTPWHFYLRAHMLSTTGRSLEIHHRSSHRKLWELPDEELQKLVDQAVSNGPEDPGDVRMCGRYTLTTAPDATGGSMGRRDPFTGP